MDQRPTKNTMPHDDYESHVKMPRRVHTHRPAMVVVVYYSSWTFLRRRIRELERWDDYVSSLAVSIWP
jgi:hypothetical protein